MTLLTRVKERVDSDLSDTELQNMIDEALSAIEDRVGPIADPAAPITVTLEGRRRKLDMLRPIDATHTVVVVEHLAADPSDVEFAAYTEDWWPSVGETAQTLATNDYRLWWGGRTVERLFNGTHPRVYWGSRVDFTYTPVDDGNQRQEVAIKLVILDLAYQGVIERTVGDTRTTFGLRSGAGGQSALVYADERERLLNSLRPRRGLMLR